MGCELRGWVSQAAKEIEEVLVELDYDSLRYAGDLDFQVHLTPKQETVIKPDFKIPDVNFSNIDSITFKV